MADSDYFNDFVRKQREADATTMYKDSYRLLCGGKVISQVNKRLGEEFALRMLERFRDHLRNAINHHDTFEFVGAGGRCTASEYLELHQERLGIIIVDDFEIVEPGVVYPLVPNALDI